MACTRGTYQPDRKPYDGFRWEHIAGAGLDFWAQTNGRLRVVTDSTLPGAVIVGIIIFHEPATFWRLLFITTLILSILGLKALG